MLQEHLEKLIETGYKLITLETDSPEQTVIDFRPLVREGKAIYLWDNDIGLRRMEASHITIPSTKSPEMILNHIKQSKLYGVYLLVGFSKELIKPGLLPILTQIASEEKTSKIVIFIDNHFNYPQTLISKILMAQEPEVRKRISLEQIA